MAIGKVACTVSLYNLYNVSFKKQNQAKEYYTQKQKSYEFMINLNQSLISTCL